MDKKPKVLRVSDWYKIYVCISCENSMSFGKVMYSEGICPHCGHDSDSTVCDTNSVILRKITYSVPGWKFWKRTYRYIGKDEFSLNWIKNKKLEEDV